MSLTQSTNVSERIYLYKRVNGYYYIGYHDYGRIRWKSTKCKFRPDALKILSDFEKNLKNKITTMLFSEFVKHFDIIRANAIRQNTLKTFYSRSFKVFKEIIGNKNLDLYTLQDVEMFKSRRLETCKPTTVNIEFRTLRAAFNLAIQWELLKENPFSKSQKLKIPEQIPTYLKKEEFQKLIQAVTEPLLKDIFIFAACTGLRLGEILNLKWKDIDFDRKQISIVNSENFNTKTGKCRIIPMNDLVKELLFKRSYHQSNFVFHRKGYPLRVCYISHKFKEYVRLLNLNEAIHFHSLRHTFATWLVQNGVNLYEVQKLLGHSSIKVTEIYSHLVASELHTAVNKISLN
jgi:integrase